jgi:hypothetical protein
MTWIVGTLTPFGLGIVASDIRVTFSNRTEVDCLQKIYSVGGGIVAGFAGSVKIGFSLLHALSYESAKLSQDSAWNLGVISNTWWPRVARRIYSSANKVETDLGSQVILVGAYPDSIQSPFAQVEMFTFSSPNFQPTKSVTIASIGCGARAPDCMKVVEKAFTKPESEFLSLYELGPLGLATGVGVTLQDTIRQNPTAGIGRLFQVAVIGREVCQIIRNEVSFKQDGTEAKFPEIARDYNSLVQFCEKNRWNAAAAVC